MSEPISTNARIFVAGHNGLVGSAICRALLADGQVPLTVERGELDLLNQSAVDDWFSHNPVEQVYLAAARVGGILANDSRPAEFLHENMVIQSNVIHSAWKQGVKKLLFLGSSCIYPREAPQPMAEECLLSGPLEATNQWYAVAKIAGIKMCQAYRRQYGFDAISVMPTNLYGPGDNFDLRTSHVLPALLRKTYEAKLSGDDSVTVWGSGRPKREFLYVDDLADACLYLMTHYSDEAIINVGTGDEVTIAELAKLLSGVVGFDGRFRFDRSKPDGTMRKFLDVSKLTRLGWSAKTSLNDGIRHTFDWYVNTIQET